jgi:alpha-tubulin suppressor-like RCC1 family protein
VILPQNDNVVQVACGQHFTLCLTLNGKIVIWGSISGKTTNDDGFFYQRPEYIFFFHWK